MTITGLKAKKNKIVTSKYIWTILLLIMFMMSPNFVFASTEKKSVSDSLRPLIAILQDLAEPVSYGFFIKGFMQMMAGNENSAKKTIKAAAAGYLGIQFIPQIMRMLKDIKF